LSFSFSKKSASQVISLLEPQTQRGFNLTKNFTSGTLSANRYFHSESSNREPNSIVPVKIYENADISKEKIIKDNTNKSGVYRWLNLLTGKSYIGSSVNLSKRFYAYFNLRHLEKRKKNSIIYSSLLKNGYSNFKLEILEYCNSSILRDRENFYIQILDPEYNILNNVTQSYKNIEESEGSRGRRLYRHSDITKAKISESAFARKEKK